MLQNINARFNDAQNEVRLGIMNFIIDNKRAFNIISDGFSVLNLQKSSEEDFYGIVKELINNDGMVANAQNEVQCIYPVSALPTSHSVTLANGKTFNTMCALDALGSTYTFQQDINIHSKCGLCGKEINVSMKNGDVEYTSTQELHCITFKLGEIQHWASSCWNVMHFFCTKSELDSYASARSLDDKPIIRADLKMAIDEAKKTFAI